MTPRRRPRRSSLPDRPDRAISRALVNGRVLLDEGLSEGRGVLIEDGRIADILPAGDRRCRRAQRHDLGGALLLPGFLDSQVNGGGGVLFNDSPDLESIRTIGRAHRRFGTTGFLPTLISDDLETIARAIAAVDAAIETQVPGVLGIHIEGPFLNVARKGVHDPAKLRRLDTSAVRLLTSLRAGRTLVTLAPEMAAPGVIAALVAAGVVVSAGHTNATYDEIAAALRHGLTGFTHLFNAMSQLTGREPGTVGAALEDPASWCGIIVDGEHTHPAVLRLALKCKPADRFMLVTDAMPSVGTGLSSFELQGRRIRVSGSVCLDEDGRLAGSNIDMASCVRNAIDLLGLPLPQAIRMASRSPAEFLRLGHETGRIARGYRANLVAADEQLTVLDTWIDGRPAREEPG
ncbi:MAG TPA: N-acetylglucosamine-6-phosphate deacetylase [Steroidobacteraceae bacterium]|nr:N-acetylglucosamine-6-phosphate deacetylase [Steroidobacteraceae bacterium]